MIKACYENLIVVNVRQMRSTTAAKEAVRIRGRSSRNLKRPMRKVKTSFDGLQKLASHCSIDRLRYKLAEGPCHRSPVWEEAVVKLA